MSIRWIAVLGLLGSLLLTACGPEVLFQEEKHLGSGGWEFADSISYAFPVSDTSGKYDLVLSVHHSADFFYQNFYVRLATHLPDGQVLVQPLSLQLANNFGDWYGACSGGTCTTDISLQKRTRFTAPGDYRLVVTQFSREDPLPGITGIGFRAVKR